MLKIKKIIIKNFRSIENMSVDCSNITTFVGANDAGKSNVLRALNLFFNDQTDHALPFQFERDYNVFSPKKQKRAKNIVVELTLELPDTYIRLDYPSDMKMVVSTVIAIKENIHQGVVYHFCLIELFLITSQQ
jgi:AAA15 family ATPase/GTPase